MPGCSTARRRGWSTCYFTCHGRHRPPRPAETQRCATRPGRHRRGQIDEHRPAPPHRLARALSDSHQRRYRTTYAHLFQRARGLFAQASAGRARCATSPAPPSSMTACCRWCIPTAWSTRPASPTCRWSSQSIRSQKVLRSAMCGGRWMVRWRGCRIYPNGRTRPGSRASVFPPLPPHYAICTGRPSRTTSRPRDWPGRGSPMTNCWPASSRSLWCARICAGRPAAARPARAACARAS